MRIKAEFIGKTSCGFTTNKIYDIRMERGGKWIWIYDRHSDAECPYTSIKKVAENWRMPVDDDEKVGCYSKEYIKKNLDCVITIVGARVHLTSRGMN